MRANVPSGLSTKAFGQHQESISLSLSGSFLEKKHESPRIFGVAHFDLQKKAISLSLAINHNQQTIAKAYVLFFI